VAIAGDGPAGFVGVPVVVAAEQDHVVDVGVAAVGPVPDVVGVAPLGWAVSAAGDVATVAGVEGPPLGGGGEAVGAAQVQGFAGGVEQQPGEVGVAAAGQQAPRRGRGSGGFGGVGGVSTIRARSTSRAGAPLRLTCRCNTARCSSVNATVRTRLAMHHCPATNTDRTTETRHWIIHSWSRPVFMRRAHSDMQVYHCRSEIAGRKVCIGSGA
jgi:hypothetical protein